jgi:hypothetical protein
MTATTVDLHPTPSLGDVFQAHFRTLYFTLRRVRWLLVIALVLLAVGEILIGRMMKRAHAGTTSPLAACIQASRKPGNTVQMNSTNLSDNLATTQMTVRSKDGKKVMECATTTNSANHRANGSTQTVSGKIVTTKVTFDHGKVTQDSTVTLLSPQEIAQQSTETEMVLAWGRASTTIMALLLIAMFTFRVWRAEPPSKRMYFFSMPMSRGEHTLVKTAAGWCWLVIGIVVVMSVALIEHTLMLTYVGSWQFTAQVSEMLWSTTNVLQNVVAPLAMATVLYLLISAFSIGVDNPGYWLSGIGLGIMILPGVFRILHWKPVGDAVLSAWSGRYGLTAIAPISAPGGSWDVTHWWAATGLWFAIGLVAVTGAAYARRP